MTKFENKWIYAAYKGDEFLCEGTREEICEHLGIKRKTFEFYRSGWYKNNKVGGSGKRKIIIRIDGKDKIWNEKE